MVIAIVAVIIMIVVVIGLFWSVGLIAALIGAFFMGITMTIIKIFIVPRFEERDKMRLATDNIRITPDKLEVRYDGYKNGYVIDCYYTSPETGKKFVFSTEPFPGDPTPYLGSANISVVTNRVDYSNYYVDIAGLNLKDRL